VRPTGSVGRNPSDLMDTVMAPASSSRSAPAARSNPPESTTMLRLALVGAQVLLAVLIIRGFHIDEAFGLGRIAPLILGGFVVNAILPARLRLPFFVALSMAAALVVLGPARILDRLTLTDVSSRDRYYMWQAGIDMILDKPVFGQGPGMILTRYPGYRWIEAPNPQTPHLHDNALQIAAERGLPCLVMWLWLVAAGMADAYREARRGLSGPGWVAGAALAVLIAVMTAGLVEYNFGDSEVLMFTLLVAALPYALRREREHAPSGAPA